MRPYYTDTYANPSAITYSMGREAKESLTKTRAKVASFVGAKPTEIIFTAGGTEANNLAISGILNNFKGSNLVISPIEHPSVYEPAKNYKYKIAQVNEAGIVDVDSIAKLIDDHTVLVSVMMVNHEIGTIQPIKEIARLVASVRKQRLMKGNKLPIYFHSDACQATNYLDIHTSKLGIDLMTINGSKIYGPKQSGFLWVKTGTKIKPLIYGGGQEHGLRSGTENLPAIVGLGVAMDIASDTRKQETIRVEKLRDDFISSLLALDTRLKLNGSKTKRIANNVHITIKGIDSEWLLIKLDEAGIEAAAGSACSASSEEASAVLRAIGLDETSARQSVRFSLGRQTTEAELLKCLKTLKSLIA
jgi:cysteine desulfurase